MTLNILHLNFAEQLKPLNKYSEDLKAKALAAVIITFSCLIFAINLLFTLTNTALTDTEIARNLVTYTLIEVLSFLLITYIATYFIELHASTKFSRLLKRNLPRTVEQFNSLHIYNREEAIAYTLLATITVQSEKLTVASVIDEEFLHSYSELLRQLPSVAYDKRAFPKHSSIEHALSREHESEIIASILEYLNCEAESLLAPCDCPKRIDTYNYFYKLYQPYMNGYLKQQFNDYLKLQNSLAKY